MIMVLLFCRLKRKREMSWVRKCTCLHLLAPTSSLLLDFHWRMGETRVAEKNPRSKEQSKLRLKLLNKRYFYAYFGYRAEWYILIDFNLYFWHKAIMSLCIVFIGIGEQLLFQLKHSLEATRDSRDAQELIEILQSPNFQVFWEVFFI